MRRDFLGSFLAVAAGHALYPFAPVFAAQAHLVLCATVRAFRAGDKLLFKGHVLFQAAVAEQGVYAGVAAPEGAEQLGGVGAAALREDIVAKAAAGVGIENPFLFKA